jgi:UDP-glucose 6-dehydrogenase
VLAVLPQAPYEKVCSAREAELIKYGGNCFLMTKVVYMNVLYDLAEACGADYGVVAEAMAADARIGASHMNVVDSSGHRGAKRGRGAGGHCFPKDFSALRTFAQGVLGTSADVAFLKAAEDANLHLLCGTDKDQDLLEEVYGVPRLKPFRSGTKQWRGVATKRASTK